MLLVPPLAERVAAAIFVEGDEEDAVEFSVEAGRNDNEGSPPFGDSVVGSYGENFIAELDVLLRLSDVGPVIEDGWPAAYGFEKRSDLIGAGFREKVGGGLWVAALPSVAIGMQPFVECL